MKLGTIRQGAATGVAPEYRIRQWVKTGDIQAVRAGSRHYVDLDTLPQQIAALMANGAREAAQDGE